MRNIKSGSLFFKVNAEAKSVIGKDLINNDNIAILELVKNSYDANSSFVKIYFWNTVNEEEASIVIEDNGHGMSFNDIKQKWLNIAYSEKKLPELHSGRRLAGNKGVGRFSCDRLGKVLDLYTLKKNGDIIHLNIDWEQYEHVDLNTEINHIPIRYNIISFREFEEETGIGSFLHGTILKITYLRSVWTENKLLSLRRELERFANPHQDVQLDSFTIRLICPEYVKSDNNRDHYEKINGIVSNTIIDDISINTSSIESKIDAGGESITTTLTHRGSRLFTIIEKNTFLQLKNIGIKVIFLGPADKALFTRRMGYQSIKFGSIFLFLNGFRISPYGEPSNDWLGIDTRKQQKAWSNLGSRDVLGRIEIDESDSSGKRWRIVSNREGLVQTPAYYELVKNEPSGYFWRVFRKLQRYVVEGIEWDSVSDSQAELENKILKAKNISTINISFQKSEKIKEENLVGLLKKIITAGGTLLSNVELIEFDPSLADMLRRQKDEKIDSFFEDFDSLIGKGIMTGDYKNNLDRLRIAIKEEKRIARKLIEERDQARFDAIEAHKVSLAAEKRASEAETRAIISDKRTEIIKRENLFLKATTSQDLTDVVNMQHQVLTWSNSIDKDCRIAINYLKKVDSDNAIKAKDILSRVIVQNKRVIKTAKFVTKKNLKLNAELRSDDLLNFIRGYFLELEQWKLFQKIGLICQIPLDASFVTMYKPLEITILIDNLITNSVKAKARHFFVSIESCSNGSLELLFDDDGIGLAGDIIEPNDIFDRGFTTTDGSGIGLNHCLDIVDEMKGTIKIIASNHGGFALLCYLPNNVRA